MDNTAFCLSILWLMDLWNVYVYFSVHICVQVFIRMCVFISLSVRIGEGLLGHINFMFNLFFLIFFINLSFTACPSGCVCLTFSYDVASGYAFLALALVSGVT